MSKLEELIQQLCPDGVKYKQIGEIAKCIAGATPKTSVSAYWQNGTIPWMSSGEVNNKIIYNTEAKITQKGYDSCSTKMVPPNTVVIALAGQGKTRGTVAITRIELCTNQSLCSIVTKPELLPDFLFHYLSGQYAKLRDISSGDGTRGGLNLKMIRCFLVPVPPLEVQQEIVRILDQFTELTTVLTTELTAELTARKKQYEYYRDELLYEESFPDVRECKLGEVTDIHTGSKPDEIFEDHSEFEYINAGTTNSGYVKTSNCPGDTVTTPSRGQGGIGFVGYQSQPFHLGPLCYSIRSRNENFIINKFIYYWLSSHTGDILAFKKEGGTPALNRGDLMGLRLYVPPISVQQRIVGILDRFDTLCNDLTSGLPAEIEARRKQYEYYRDKLLTFKKKASDAFRGE